MIEVTNEQVTQAIVAVVGFAGRDYVYPTYDGSGCFYVYNDEPSCLVGRVLHRLGADIQDLRACDELGGINDAVLERVDIQMSKAAQTALRYAQGAQDQRKTWGHALDCYLKVVAYEESKA